MQTLNYNLSRWTTEELLAEVVRRTAADAPGLQRLETIVLRARLAESDRRTGEGVQSEFVPTADRSAVGGTIEMGLAGRAPRVLEQLHAPKVDVGHAGGINPTGTTQGSGSGP